MHLVGEMSDHLRCAHAAPKPVRVRLEAVQPFTNQLSARVVKQAIPNLHPGIPRYEAEPTE